MDEISFCVLSRDSSVEELESCLSAIQAQNVPEFEVLIYHSDYSSSEVRNLYNREWGEDIPVNRIRNLLCKNTKHEFIALVDARITLSNDWYQEIKASNFFDLMGWSIQDSEGNRIPDWSHMVQVGTRRIVLQLDYEEWSRRGFVNTSAMLGRKAIWERVEFDETIAEGLETDASFCQKVMTRGYRIGIAQNASGKTSGVESNTNSLSASTYDEARIIYSAFNLHNKQASEAYKRGDYDEAETHFRKVLGISGQEKNALCQLGWIKYFKGEYSEACDFFEKTLELDACLAASLRGLGWVYLQMQNYEQAIRYLTDALNLISDGDKSAQWETLRGLGWANYSAGAAEVSVEYFRKILEDNPVEHPGIMQDIHRGLGWCYSKLGKVDEAKDNFEAALKYIDVNRDKKVLSEIQNGLDGFLSDGGSIAEENAPVMSAPASGPPPRPLWLRVVSRVKRMLVG